MACHLDCLLPCGILPHSSVWLEPLVTEEWLQLVNLTSLWIIVCIEDIDLTDPEESMIFLCDQPR